MNTITYALVKIHKWLNPATKSFKCNVDTIAMWKTTITVAAYIRDNNDSHFVQTVAKKPKDTPIIA
jgi:hypothetical protein